MNLTPETHPANPNPTPTEGRDASGRFAKGNPGGPGNPFPRRVAALRQALLNCVTEEDIMAITKAVIEEARGGNMAAAKLIYQYVLGKPSAADTDRNDAVADFARIATGASGVLANAGPANGSIGKTEP